jgi:arabinogalactan oligomer/maltooligosaccharide transport system substrate-binding protein
VVVGVFALIVLGCGRGIDEEATGVTTTAVPAASTTTVAPVDTEVTAPATELVVWVPLRSRAAVQEAANMFTTATGIGVAIETVAMEDMEAAINSGAGPDIFVGLHTWLSRLAPRGLALPVSLEPRLDEFVAVAADAFTYEGVIYGAPMTMQSIALFHNATVVPTAPAAVSEVKEICDQLRGDSATTTTGETTTTTATTLPPAAGAACLEFLADDARVSLALLTAGDGYLYRRVEGQYLADDVGLTTESVATRAETLRDLAADGVISGAVDRATMVERFGSGETPFLIGDIELAEAISSSGTPFGVAPLPIITGTTPQPFVDVTGFMVAGRSAQPETALLFLNDYLVTGTTMADLFAASAGLSAYRSVSALVVDDPVVAGLQAAAEAGVPMPVVDGIADVMTALGPVLAGVLDVAGDEELPSLLSRAAELALSLAA